MSGTSEWSISVWAGLLGTPLLISTGQVMFKLVSARTEGVNSSTFRTILVDPYFIGAMVVYAIATFTWIFVLRSVPLAAAYSFTALGFLFVPVLSFVLFGEAITARYFAGAFLVISGLTLIHT